MHYEEFWQDTIWTGNKAGKYKEAEKLALEVLDKWMKILSDSDPHTLAAMGNLALAYSNLNESKKAEELEVVVLKKWTELLGDNHPETLLAMSSQAVGTAP
ncbi:hypothetical protein B0H13DRAFT_2352782 [Mycena leptocephala]|nr:hypothetical protein B0H13DRAFT_2352782 [Mycena leptocephala]